MIATRSEKGSATEIGKNGGGTIVTSSGSGGVIDSEERGLKYRLRVLMTHPSENLDWITRETGLTPKVQSRKGEQRSPQFSAWSYSQDKRNSRSFSEGIRSILDTLAPAADSIKRLRSTGGRAMLIVELEGDRNIGDVIDACELYRLAEVGLDFGIEVYPDGF